MSENSKFSAACQESGIIFIGPTPESIEALGSKMSAKMILSSEKDVPLIPGYNGKDQTLSVLIEEACKIEFPVLIKASAGGGGKGMKLVRKKEDLESFIDSAKTEAKNSFGDDKVLIEKYFENSRHIEIQIFGDTHGNVIHLFERECSVQRRLQKVIEESPSPILPSETRNKIANTAVKIGKIIKYTGAGTVEFLYDEKTDKFYFLEVNTRLQVEHPVTEYVTGLDLVRLQIEIARGKSLNDLIPKNLEQKGHAIECRLYAEDPENNYFPCPGKILKWEPFQIKDSRFDCGILSGSEISVYYDPMISKIITYGKNRNEAIDKMILVLSHTIVLGIITNKDFLIDILKTKEFKEGKIDTMFLDRNYKYEKKTVKNLNQFLILAMINDYKLNEMNKTSLIHTPSGFRNSPYKKQVKYYEYKKEIHPIYYNAKKNTFEVSIKDKNYLCEIISWENGKIEYSINEKRQKAFIIKEKNNIYIHSDDYGDILLIKKSLLESSSESSSGNSGSSILAEVPGKILKIIPKNGEQIKKGQVVVVIESMKMENKKYAPKDGIVKIYVKENQIVTAETLLVSIE